MKRCLSSLKTYHQFAKLHLNKAQDLWNNLIPTIKHGGGRLRIWPCSAAIEPVNHKLYTKVFYMRPSVLHTTANLQQNN